MKLFSAMLVLFLSYSQLAISAPIPVECRASKTFKSYVGQRLVTWSGLDRNECVYRRESFSVSTHKLFSQCQELITQNGYDGNGVMDCRADISKPAIPPSINCSGPPSVYRWTQTWNVSYRLSSEDFHAAKCVALNDCLENTLTDPEKIRIAEEWHTKLSCSY